MQQKLTGVMSGLASVTLIVLASEMAQDAVEGTDHFGWIPGWAKPFVWGLLVFLASMEASKAREALI